MHVHKIHKCEVPKNKESWSKNTYLYPMRKKQNFDKSFSSDYGHDGRNTRGS